MISDASQLFRDVVQRYERPLIRYAQNFVGQMEDARDIVQDVFVKYSQAQSTVDHDRVAPWLFTVCRNRATITFGSITALVIMETETLDLEEAATAAPGAELEDRENRNIIARLLTRLPEKQREAIRLKFIGGLSYQEISATMQTSVGNVGYLIHHGVSALREQWLALEAQPARAC